MTIKVIFLIMVLTMMNFELIGQDLTAISFKDGTYRGGYSEVENQVFLEFTLKNNIVEKISFRNLFYNGIDYGKSNDENAVTIRNQHKELIGYLKGKDIRTALEDLYEPGKIITKTANGTNKGNANSIQAFSGATIRSGKVISAIRDALNRGVYRY